MAMNKRDQLEKLVADMKNYADEAGDREATADDTARLVKQYEDMKRLVDEIRVEAKMTGTIDVAQALLAELAGSSAGGQQPEAPVVPSVRAQKSGIVDPNGMTFGEAFVKSPAYDGFLTQYRGSDGRIREVGNVKSDTFDVPGFRSKALLTGANDSAAGAFVTPYRYAPVVDLIGNRELSVRDLCTNVSIQSDSFEFVQVTGKTNNAAAVAEATTSADNAVYGTPIAGSGLKPESDLAFAVVSTPVETIAHLMPITRRAAADAPQVRQLVDAFLIQGLKEKEEDQILNGNGTSPNVRGILQAVGISTVGSAGTDIDAVVDAIRVIRNERRRPTAIVAHPDDWYSAGFLTAKDSTGQYLIGDPRASIEQLNTLWGLRVVVTEAMTVNTLLVGDFTQAIVADREQSAIYVTDSHKDWFARNLLAVLAEERLAVGVLDAKAFCTVTAV